ncbi:MAG: PEGA domain-containing protein [Myxococcota bacterium]
MRMVVIAVVLSLCGPMRARAQSDNWLVLPTSVDEDTAWMAGTSEQLGRELRRQGIGVWSSRSAVKAFESRDSSAAVTVSGEDFQAWSGGSQAALRALAMADYERALAGLRKSDAFSSRTLETLNRDGAHSQAVLDTCLYLVRALEQTGDSRSAKLQAQACVRKVPEGEPNLQMHPPAVVELYETAKRPGPSHASRLLVETEPRGCALRLNGIKVGETPYEVTDLYPGPYRVQVECEPGVVGRVHKVDVPSGATSLFVFDRFDRAVRTEPVLHLQYPSPPDLPRLARDTRQLARALPAAAVVVASVTDSNDALELRVISGTQVDASLVRVPTTPEGLERQRAAEATTALLAGECKDFTSEPPVAIDCRTGEAATTSISVGTGSNLRKSRRVRPPRPQFIAGVTLAASGTTSLLTGYALLAARRPAGNDWASGGNNLNAQDKWLGIGTGLIVTGTIGGGLLVAAMPVLLPYERKTPWWAWIHGALGIAAATGAVVSGVTAAPKPPESCTTGGPDPRLCVERGRDTDRAVLLSATAVPLLTVPLVYLLRRGEKRRGSDVVPSVHTARRGGAIVFHGSF